MEPIPSAAFFLRCRRYELQGRHEAAETVLRVIDALDELTTGGKGGDRADEDQEPWRLRKPFGSTVKSAGKQDAAARTASSTKATKARFARFMAARWAGIDSEEKKVAEKRIVDIGPLLEDLKNELEDLKGATEVLTVEEAAEDEIEELKKLLVIDPQKMIPAWRDPDKDPPKVETEVLVCTGAMAIWVLQRRTTKTAMFSPRTANGIGKIFPIGEHTTRSGTTTESRKAGGNTATSTRTRLQ